MVWRCGGTYSWIYWYTKEMDIGDFFLPLLNIILAALLKDL
jgi:hypothetical protein